MSCRFCAIVAGAAPAITISEDADYLAILDIRPFTRGHTLVIPKHSTARNFLEEEPQVIGPLMLGVQRVARAVRAAEQVAAQPVPSPLAPSHPITATPPPGEPAGPQG